MHDVTIENESRIIECGLLFLIRLQDAVLTACESFRLLVSLNLLHMLIDPENQVCCNHRTKSAIIPLVSLRGQP